MTKCRFDLGMCDLDTEDGHMQGGRLSKHSNQAMRDREDRIRVLEAALRAVDLAWANVQVGHEPYWVKRVREALNHA